MIYINIYNKIKGINFLDENNDKCNIYDPPKI